MEWKKNPAGSTKMADEDGSLLESGDDRSKSDLEEGEASSSESDLGSDVDSTSESDSDSDDDSDGEKPKDGISEYER